MNRFFGRIALMGLLGLAVGCGGDSTLEDLPSQETSTVSQGAEEPRKVDDLIGALDRQQGVLYTRDDSQATVLKELQAQQVSSNTYLTKDTLTGEETRFVIKLYPIPTWPTYFKLCPNGQWVLSYQTCPDLILNDTLTRVWRNSSCNRIIQSASSGVCTNAGGGSYRYQYLESWKCGVGTGFCVERRSAKAIRYDYNLAACDPSLISNVQSTNYDFLCKH